MDVPPLTVLEVGESLKDGVLDGAGAGENGEVWEVGYFAKCVGDISHPRDLVVG